MLSVEVVELLKTPMDLAEARTIGGGMMTGFRRKSGMTDAWLIMATRQMP